MIEYTQRCRRKGRHLENCRREGNRKKLRVKQCANIFTHEGECARARALADTHMKRNRKNEEDMAQTLSTKMMKPVSYLRSRVRMLYWLFLHTHANAMHVLLKRNSPSSSRSLSFLGVLSCLSLHVFLHSAHLYRYCSAMPFTALHFWPGHSHLCCRVLIYEFTLYLKSIRKTGCVLNILYITSLRCVTFLRRFFE